jgi:sec-independent protein translocase protein TatB
MFEVGITEIILIFGIALLVLGPQRLPKLAADVGRWAGRARAMARQLRTQLEQETHFDPLADPEPAAKAATSSSTIHAPAPPPPPVDNEARAVPAQLAADAPAPASAVTSAVMEEPAPILDPSPDAPAPPDKTVADEPKHG